MVVRLVFKDWWRARFTVPTARRRTKRWLAKTWPVLCSRVGLVVTDRNRRTSAVTESSPSLTGLRWSPKRCGARRAGGAGAGADDR